jgi:hypothetical protein
MLICCMLVLRFCCPCSFFVGCTANKVAPPCSPATRGGGCQLGKLPIAAAGRLSHARHSWLLHQRPLLLLLLPLLLLLLLVLSVFLAALCHFCCCILCKLLQLGRFSCIAASAHDAPAAPHSVLPALGADTI